LALAAIMGLWVINVFISHATINIYARGTALKNDLAFTIDPTAKATDTAGGVVMGQLVTASRDATAPLTATGKKDVGTKASGEVTIYNNYDAASHTIPAGTKLVSSDGRAFVTKAATVVPGLTVVVLPGPKLSTVPGSSGSVPVEAIASGDQYNLAANTAYAVSAQPDKIYATGKQMSGGLSKSITIVSQVDIDKAKADALATDLAPGKTEATGKLMSGYTAIENSFAQAVGELSASPALDAEAPSGSGTVTVHLNYSLLAYSRADLVALGRSNLSRQITADMQIYDDGSGDAQIVSGDKPGSYHFVALAYVGSRIDTTKLTSSVTGKRYGDAVDLIGRLPGVEKVEVNLSPSWNTSLPLLGDHIRTTIKVSPKG
jgi:Baseplate J-like protein